MHKIDTTWISIREWVTQRWFYSLLFHRWFIVPTNNFREKLEERISTLLPVQVGNLQGISFLKDSPTLTTNFQATILQVFIGIVGSSHQVSIWQFRRNKRHHVWAAETIETLLKNAGSLMTVMVSTPLAVLFLMPPPACANIVMSTCSCQKNRQNIIIY